MSKYEPIALRQAEAVADAASNAVTEAEWALLTRLYARAERARSVIAQMDEAQAAVSEYEALRCIIWDRYGMTEADRLIDRVIHRSSEDA
jgi:hypothetical protein